MIGNGHEMIERKSKFVKSLSKSGWLDKSELVRNEPIITLGNFSR